MRKTYATFDTREMELQWFVQNLEGDPPDLIMKKIWLHSRWYEDEDYNQILDIAKKHKARMTFCFLGRDVEYRTRIIQRMVNEGHEVATHGARHYLIDDRFGYAEMHRELIPCVDDLAKLGVTVKGMWISAHGILHRDTPQALVDHGIEWFSSGKDHDQSKLPTGLRFIPMLKPHDFEILFVHPISPQDALVNWKKMLDHRTEGTFLFHPFTLTRLERSIMDAWDEFLSYSGGSIPAYEHSSESRLPSIIFDSSLHLHTA